MKILQILNPSGPIPAKTIGGKERIVQYLIDGLVEEGHDVTLLGHDDSKPSEGVKFEGIGTYETQEEAQRKVWKHLLKNNYDVIHNHGRLLYFLPVIWSKVRKVHTFHMGELGITPLKRFISLAPKNFAFAPCGNWIKETYQNIGGKWTTINNGIPADMYCYKQNDPFDLPLVVISRMTATKGIAEAIKIAMAANKGLIIAGEIGDEVHEREWFEDKILKYCDGDKIKFIGPVDDGQKQKLLTNASALLLPVQTSEAFNTTMIEANACGCPVISFNKYCFPEFVENGINGFLGETLADLVDSVNKIHLIDRTKCRQVFENKYTSRTMVQNYLKLYTS